MDIGLRRLTVFVLALMIGGLAGLGMAPAPVAADPPPCADLVVTDFTIGPATPPPFQIVEGMNAKIEITVLNQGTCQSLSFVVQWKSDRLAPTGPSTYVEGLSANQSNKVIFNYAFPRSGNFTTVATVDTESSVDETNESNNLAIKDVTVLPDMADLVITDFTILPSRPVQGINAQINIRVKNQGTKDAGPFVVQWKSNKLAPTGPSQQVAGLAASASVDVSFEYAFPSAGDFTSVATVDTDRSVEEWNEDNNVELLAVNVRPALPDLVVTAFNIAPVDPAPGYPILPVAGLNARIDIEILNQGNADAGPFVVQWKSARTAPTGPTDHVSGLTPGASTVVSFEYAFPNAGNFTTVATVDSDNSVDEINESNNLAIEHIIVQQPEIDLVVTVFKVEPAPGIDTSIPPLPVQGRLSKATITVANQGNFPAGDFVVQWKPTLLLPDLSAQVNGLKYGQSKTITFDYTYPSAGTFQTRATVDAPNRIPETNEFNNTETKEVVVEPQRPDLEITAFVIVPAQPVQGTKATASITVRNRGNTAAGFFIVQWKPTPFRPALSQQVNGLGVGLSKTVSFDFTYTIPGLFTTTAVVDTPNRILELDEGNNTRVMPVIVQRATQDLVITDFRIVQGVCEEEARTAVVEPVVKQGANIQACITVQNLGNSPIGPFVVSWNPDAFGLIVPSPSTKTHQVDSLDAGQETLVVFDFVYTQAGNFRTVAEVDAFNNVRETNESNNIEILNVVVEATGPDLVIDELVVEPGFTDDQIPGRNTCYLERDGRSIPPGIDLEEPRLTQGEPNRVCIKVRNQGDRPSGPFVVEWNPDAFGLITPGPSTVSTQVDNLDPNGFILVEFSFTYDQAGTFRTIAKADAFNNVKELLEGNNEKIRNVVVDPVGPDLMITSLNVYDGNRSCDEVVPESVDAIEPTLRQGEVATICIDVYNQGTRPAGPFVVEWNPDAFGLITPSPGTLSTQIDGLDVFDTKTIKFNFTYHQHGEFRTIANADAFNNVPETNEANNLKIQNVIVNPANIDLRITGFTVSGKHGPDVIRGSKAVAAITVRNFGTYPTGAFSVQWRITSEDGSGPFARIDGLQPFGQAGDSKTVYPEGVFYIAGPYQSWAKADIFDEVIETDETNNTKTVDVTVKPRETELRVTFINVHIRDAEDVGDLEWLSGFVVLEEDAVCAVKITVDPDIGSDFDIAINEKGFHCRFWKNNDADANKTYSVNQAIDTTIVESAPLLLGALALELDAADWGSISSLGASPADIAPDFGGFAIGFHTAGDRWGAGETFTLTAQEGDSDLECTDGKCFDVTYKVDIIAEPPPLAFGAQAELPPESIVLPAALVNLLQIPPDAKLPDGVTRWHYQFLPAVIEQD